jgi:hypothetical protein
MKLELLMNHLWMANFALNDSNPSWTGFMQTAVRSENHHKTRVEILPFINLDPSNPSTIYTALSFAKKEYDLHGINTCFVTFDQPLYIKAAEIVAASKDLPNVVVRLGGFHLLMSYMGSVGYIMDGSGLSTLWETVYAAGSVIHMMTGHAYARAVRAHLLTSAALCSLLLLKLEDKQLRHKLSSLYEQLMNADCPTDMVLQDSAIQQLLDTVSNLMDEQNRKSRTGRLCSNACVSSFT